ncbi:hypothetical protein CLOM_g8819 [Closterium sp. NIES-68]|nr:hypothetical protein CLOM_g8819 [Closterium sp. NIES-68]GJP66228.1 hypothetical protein CLOP_g23127 [Closterium sp. NIES-67]
MLGGVDPPRSPGGKPSLVASSPSIGGTTGPPGLMSPSKMTGPPTLSAFLLPLIRRSRIQWGLGLLWIVLCLKVMKDSVDRMDRSLQSLFFYEAFLYYNPLLMIALMVWLWGINLYGLAHSRVSYAKVFDLDHNHLTHAQIWQVSAALSLAVLSSMTAYMFLFSHGLINFAATQPVLMYCSLPLTLALPFDVLYAPSRVYFLTTLFRLTFPLQPISFADFFVADVLTSMAKALSDVERSICRMSHGQVASIAWMDAGDVCGSHSIMIPVVLAFPYACRFFQCLRQYSDTRDKSCLLNALKYSTAFPVIILSATKYHVPVERWRAVYRPLWLMASVVNSCYSYYWDISRDWDFGCFSGNCNSRNPLLRNNLYFPQRWVYYWVMCSNLVLRISWTYKLSSHLRNNLATTFVVTALEMVRRFQWVFFRVENEWNKMTMRAAASAEDLKGLAASEDQSDDIPLLNVTGGKGSPRDI